MTDSALPTAAAGVIGTMLAVGIGLAALIVTGAGRLPARPAAVEKEQARTSGRPEGLEFTGRALRRPAPGAESGGSDSAAWAGSD